MCKMSTAFRIAIVLIGCFLTGASGCAASGKAGGLRRAGGALETHPDVDPSKACVPLSQIEPLPSKPEAPPSLDPLSIRASRKISRASDLVNEQRYTEAAIELERALRYHPNHPQIHRSLALLHFEAGNLERAKAHASRALEGNPDDAAAHFISGRCAALEGHQQTALTAFRTALLCSDFGDDRRIAALCHYYLAETLAAQGYLEAALTQHEAFQKDASELVAAAEADAADPLLPALEASAGRARSDILEKLGRYSEAAEALAPLLAGSPKDVELGLRVARLLQRAGRLEEALAVARDIRSDDPAVIELLHEIHTAAGRPEGVIDDLRAQLADSPDNPRLMLSLADMLMRLGRPDGARRELEDYLARNPDDLGVRARLIDVHVGRLAWDDVLAVCAEGIERHPEREEEFSAKIAGLSTREEAVKQLLVGTTPQDSAAGSYLRGVLAVAAGELDTAERFLELSRAKQPDSVPVRELLARVYLRLYRYDEAIRVAGRRSEETPDDAGLEMVLGDVFERLDDVERAELHYKAAIQLDRADSKAMFALAKLYSRSGRRLQAQRQLRVLLEKGPGHDDAREMLAYTYFEEGKPDVAIEQFEELMERTDSPLTRARCAALLGQARQRDSEAYRRTLQGAIEEHGGDATTWIAVAQSYDADIEPERRLEAYQQALALDPDREDAVLGSADTLQRLLAFEEAAEQLRALLPRRPNRERWRLALIDVHWTLQDYDAALTLARRGADGEGVGEPWQERYRLAMVDTLRQAGRKDEAIAELTRWAEAEPEGVHKWSEFLAREYIRQDQAPKAVTIFEAILRAHPDDPNAVPRVIGALTAAERYDRASQYTLDWLDDDPGNENALARQVEILRRAERYDEALELIRNRLPNTFARERYQDLMVGVLAGAERYEACIDLIEELIDEVVGLLASARQGHIEAEGEEPAHEVLARRPNEPYTLDGLYRRLGGLRSNFAYVLIISGQDHEAERQLTSWLEMSRNPAERFEFLTRLAWCHRRLGNESRASEILARALLLQPSEITLNNDVAYEWIDHGVRLDEAERMIRFALSHRPRQAAYLDTYGWLQYKKGRFAEARKWLERAAATRGGADPVVLDHLGDTLWRLDKTKEAVRYWEAAVQAVGERTEEDFQTQDERRVRDQTPKKMDDVGVGRTPAVAPLAVESPGGEGNAEGE